MCIGERCWYNTLRLAVERTPDVLYRVGPNGMHCLPVQETSEMVVPTTHNMHIFAIN